jgi:hypothetical protein
LPSLLDDLYIIKLSYYFYEIEYATIFNRQRGDFSEVLLHHVLTIVLVIFSYSISFLPIGAVIMLVMDASDIFVCIFKICADVSKNLTLASYLPMFISWVYLRMYLFPFGILLPFYYE